MIRRELLHRLLSDAAEHTILPNLDTLGRRVQDTAD